MNSVLARDKVTIFDKALPRVQMNLSQLKRHHAKILRSFAEYPEFNSEKLSYSIKAREHSRAYDFDSMTEFLDYLQDPENETPDTLELKYQYASVLVDGERIEPVTMTASVLFGETGRNECYITSNDEVWAADMHDFIRSDLNKYKIFRYAEFAKRVAFVLAVACLMLFGAKFFTFASPQSVASIIAFFLASLVVAWPMHYFPFKQISSNRIFLS